MANPTGMFPDDAVPSFRHKKSLQGLIKLKIIWGTDDDDEDYEFLFSPQVPNKGDVLWIQNRGAHATVEELHWDFRDGLLDHVMVYLGDR